ncbi:MAG: hypothetical protein AMXMBFR82_31070 [Candidatus Hydrogenedentota bacterium]
MMDTSPSQDQTHASVAACVSCHGSLEPFGPREGYHYYRCTECGNLQLFPLPTRAELDEAYRKDYATAGHCRSDVDEQTGAARPYYEAIASVLKAHEAGSRVLEIGSGWGGLCEVLLAEGFDYAGIDVSEEMVAHCQRRGFPVEFRDVRDVTGGPFDALVMSAVFEHIVEHDAWLEHARSLLREGGLFVSMQPTARFATFMGSALRLGWRNAELPQLHQVFCPPWHTVLFSIDGMSALMKRRGFELVDVRLGPQARGRGMTGLAQRGLAWINRLGWPVLGTRWPMAISHIFVFRKAE